MIRRRSLDAVKTPRLRRLRVRPIRGFPVNRMIPNIVTLLALCAGMTSIRLALNDHFTEAVAAIFVAAIFDGLDGRIARLLKGTSEFGAELDSLSDFISFGVAPGLLVYIWTLHTLSSIGWVVSLLYAMCCALRLARFNSQIGADLPPYAYNFFTGVPAPAAAGLAMVPMILQFETGWDGFRNGWFAAAVLAAVAALMVSRVPTFSMKRFRIPREWVLPLFLLIGAMAALATTEPWATVLVVGVIYVGSFPFSIRAFIRLRRAAEELRASGRGEIVDIET